MEQLINDISSKARIAESSLQKLSTETKNLLLEISARNIKKNISKILSANAKDIEVATNIAKNMVTKWGLSKALGPLKYGEDEGSPFLGRSASSAPPVRSEETSKVIDAEVKSIIDSCYASAEKLLKDNMAKLHTMAEALLKYETIDADQIDDIMAVKVRSYTLNETGETHIGVVAQELEASGMSGLVQEDEEGMKSVKYSILYMKAIKALQEAVTRIETLEAEVAALKGA